LTDIGPIIVSIVCVLYVLYSARKNSGKARADRSGNLAFALTPTLHIGLKVASLALAGGAILSFLDGVSAWIPVLFLASASVSAAVTNVIVITPQGVERRTAWGLLTTRIGWSDIESAFEVPGEGTIVLQSKNGSRVSHSTYHADHERFLAELSNRGVAVNRQGDF
jgi:hypothetical protein